METHLKDFTFLIISEIRVLDTNDLLVCKNSSEMCGKDLSPWVRCTRFIPQFLIGVPRLG